MPNVNHHPTTKHRVQTGRFSQVKNQQALRNRLALEKAIISSTCSCSNSFSSASHLNKSGLVTGLLAAMALSAVVMPCVQSASIQTPHNPEFEFAPEPLPPAPIKGGTPIKGTLQSKCLVDVTLLGENRCTGSVIAPKVVLTAQHCLFKSSSKFPHKLLKIADTNNLRVKVVDGDLQTRKKTHEVEAAYLADGFLDKNQYTYNTMEENAEEGRNKNDLAVLKLKTDIHCEPHYKLPTETIISKSIDQCKRAQGNFTIRGYGRVRPVDDKNLAREAKVQCNSWQAITSSNKGGTYKLSNSKGETVASGDSGGPLTFDYQNEEYQVAVCRGFRGGSSLYSSLRGRIEAINETITRGDTSRMLKIGCVKLYSHFSFLWENSQRITLTNTCQQTEQVILAMGESDKDGVMLDEFENYEHEKNKLILTSGQSMIFSIPKTKRPVFPLSRSLSSK